MRSKEDILNSSTIPDEMQAIWQHVQRPAALNAMDEYAKEVAERFSEWLQENRWFSFTNGKWYYTFEQGTAISEKAYQNNYVKTTEQLFNQFLQEIKQDK